MEIVQGGEEILPEKDDRSDMNSRRKNIVRGLPPIHVVVWMDRPIDPSFASQNFIGPVGDHFIRIHVGGSSGASLKDVDWKLFVPPSFHHLLGSLRDGPG